MAIVRDRCPRLQSWPFGRPEVGFHAPLESTSFRPLYPLHFAQDDFENRTLYFNSLLRRCPFRRRFPRDLLTVKNANNPHLSIDNRQVGEVALLHKAQRTGAIFVLVTKDSAAIHDLAHAPRFRIVSVASHRDTRLSALNHSDEGSTFSNWPLFCAHFPHPRGSGIDAIAGTQRAGFLRNRLELPRRAPRVW